MDLAAHQRTLLELLRSGISIDANDDPYLHHVAHSPDLQEGRRNIFLWRVFVLERTAVLTVALLRQRHLFEATLNDFIAGHNISPFRETQGPDFLETLCTHPDPLVASVAQFERALLKVNNGDSASYVVDWKVEPHGVLHCLARGLPLDGELGEGDYRILISRDLPRKFEIVSRDWSSETQER
jgi:hypothetical protein